MGLWKNSGLFVYLAASWICKTAVGTELCFQNDFAFGVSTAAYQIEGAWNVSGKGENIWDRYTHEHPDRVFDHMNADVACDSFHKFKTDADLIGELGVSFYRFSMSWSRLLPNGLSNEVNEDGVRYYKELIKELHKHNVQALVTIYHWDLPQNLQDLGGWTNPVMADYFVDYARFLFRNFGDIVKAWITFNEPLTFCQQGYGGDDAPGRASSGFEDYLCAHTVLKAHGMAYRMYKKDFDKNNQGYMGISLDMPWMEPETTNTEDKVAAETARQFMFGWFANPIFTKQGDYPSIMRRRIDIISKLQGFTRSRLPSFTKEEIGIIRGSADFLGLNHYTTNLVTPGDSKISLKPNFHNDMGVNLSVSPLWPMSNSSWLRVVPWGFRKTLNWIKNSYDNPSVVVTENGVSVERGLGDVKRIHYIDRYLRSLHAAVYKDRCDVIGYSYWSLMDNFEWMRGFSHFATGQLDVTPVDLGPYSLKNQSVDLVNKPEKVDLERFGLYEVDFNSPRLTRTPRMSVAFYGYVARTGCIPDLKDTRFH